jgi:outer membrane protein
VPLYFEPVFTEIPDRGLSAAVDSLIERALVSRPDLQASRALAHQASANARLVRSRMLPSLTATGSAGRTWLEGIPGYMDGYSGILLLQIPIFDGFSRQYDLVEAKAAAEAARDRAQAAEQSVILDVFSAHSDFLTACERVKTTNDLVESAVLSEDAVAGRYKEGVGSILDLLSAQRILAAARAERVNARLGWFTALARLAHDTGILGIHGDNPLVPGAF